MDGFLATADSLSRAGNVTALADWVERHPLLIGAAVAALVDRAARDTDSHPNTIDLGERIARMYADAGGTDVPLSLIRTFAGWTAEQRRQREDARVLHDRADSLRTSQPAAALHIYQQILPVYESIGDGHSIALLWGGMGVAHWYLGAMDRVREDYRLALEARRMVEDRILEGKTLNGLGSVNLQSGNLSEAARYYSEAIELRRRVGDLSGLGTSLTYLGHAYYKMGSLVDARDYYREALPILERVGTASQMADLLNGIANCYSEMGRHQRANENYREAADLARAAGDGGKEARFRINLADSYQRTGRYGDALQQLQRVDSLAATGNDPELPALLYSTRGQVNVAVGALSAAREDFVAGVSAAEGLSDPRHLMDALLNLAFLYGELGALERGLETAKRALELAEEHGNTRKYRNAVVVAANLHYAEGDAQQALEDWKKALALDEFENVAARALEDRISIASLLAALDRPDEARDLCYEIAPEVKTPRVAVSFHLGLAHSFERVDPDSAAWHYEKALSVLESSRMELARDERRSAFLSGDRRYYFEEVARYYASRDQAQDGAWSARAFRTIERAKARGLLDLLSGAVLASPSQQEEGLLDRLHHLDKAGAPVPERHELEEKIARLRQNRIATALGSLENGSTVVEVDEVCAALPGDGAMLQYALGDTASMVWVVDGQGHHLEFLPPRVEIEAMVQRFRDAVGRPGGGDAALRAVSRALYRTLVEPVESRLSGIDLLVIVPDGQLHGLPFDALLTGTSDAAWGSQPYLCRRWTTLYSPSASIFARFIAERTGTPAYGADLIALGDPDFSLLAASLEPLPHARTEVAAIASFAAAPRRDVRVGSEATEARARAALTSIHARVLHLATHGRIDPLQPERSEVVLSPDAEGEYDGYLTMMEIASLPGRAGLVVLSACESGLGKVFRGEGVVGLSRAFIAAGCGGTVVSLWPVADASTAVLMEAFYGGMLGRRESAAAALRDAREELIANDTYAHPFYWSPFVVIGGPRSPW